MDKYECGQLYDLELSKLVPDPDQSQKVSQKMKSKTSQIRSTKKDSFSPFSSNNWKTGNSFSEISDRPNRQTQAAPRAGNRR